MSQLPVILQIAIPAPLRRLFDYLPPKDMEADHLQVGMRVKVPFGRTRAVGLIVGISDKTDVPIKRLRAVEKLLDDTPLLAAADLKLLHWAARYYHHPIGEVIATALPVLLRQGEKAQVNGLTRWRLTESGRDQQADALKRAPRQQQLLTHLQQTEAPSSGELTHSLGDGWRGAAKALEGKGWLERFNSSCLDMPSHQGSDNRPTLTAQQESALQRIEQAEPGFAPYLLYGVTGSGKTEVYLRLIEQVAAQGKQVLVLVPEIGLTPQLLQRFRRRLNWPMAVMHSALTDKERLCAWLKARDGEARIVIGTRSAVFTPLAEPGLIIIDEEHDGSLKQQDGFRYNARDIAVIRAHHSAIPIVMGSATPALESLANAEQQRYTRLDLTERAGNARPPEIHLLDIRSQPLYEGLSTPLLKALEDTLRRGEQAMLFLNRRGYAPVVLCHDCGWIADCQRCDAHMTWHARQNRLCCHHCDASRALERTCPNCGSPELRPVGMGTERIEEALRQRFSDIGIARVDRDSTRRKGSLEEILDDIRQGKVQLLIGTQMLAKGHHFPDVTLVGILDVDAGLFSPDFRGPERVAQLVLQVAGRAGRAEKPGKVIIQTHYPDHPQMRSLIDEGYSAFAEQALNERRQADLPPYTYHALIRAEANEASPPLHFLQEAASLALSLGKAVDVLGPIPAAMERRQGRFRAQLLLQANQRAELHQLLAHLLQELPNLSSARKIRWHVDIDPTESA